MIGVSVGWGLLVFNAKSEVGICPVLSAEKPKRRQGRCKGRSKARLRPGLQGRHPNAGSINRIKIQIDGLARTTKLKKDDLRRRTRLRNCNVGAEIGPLMANKTETWDEHLPGQPFSQLLDCWTAQLPIEKPPYQNTPAPPLTTWPSPSPQPPPRPC